MSPARIERFQSVTGQGVTGVAGERTVGLGNLRLLGTLGVDATPLVERAEALRRDGQTVIHLVADGRVAGLLGVADPIKAETPEAIRQLHESSVRVVMLTGDSRTTAEAVARTLGLDEVIAEVQPAEKANVVERLRSEGHVVAMAGDGVNDAPALARADVGIAMGTGTDVAMESAGVTLVKGDLRGIARARRLSRATMRNIRENLLWAFLYNALGVPIAAGVLYPVVRRAPVAHDRQRRDELELRLGDPQRAPASSRGAVSVASLRRLEIPVDRVASEDRRVAPAGDAGYAVDSRSGPNADTSSSIRFRVPLAPCAASQWRRLSRSAARNFAHRSGDVSMTTSAAVSPRWRDQRSPSKRIV